MKLRVFTVYDSKVDAFMQPFFMRSAGEALRGWEDVVNDPKTQFFKHPEDFTLFEIAEYDEHTGKFHNHMSPISLQPAITLKKDSGIVNINRQSVEVAQ